MHGMALACFVSHPVSLGPRKTESGIRTGKAILLKLGFSEKLTQKERFAGKIMLPTAQKSKIKPAVLR